LRQTCPPLVRVEIDLIDSRHEAIRGKKKRREVGGKNANVSPPPPCPSAAELMQVSLFKHPRRAGIRAEEERGMMNDSLLPQLIKGTRIEILSNQVSS
jgi:hypothetical protein